MHSNLWRMTGLAPHAEGMASFSLGALLLTLVLLFGLQGEQIVQQVSKLRNTASSSPGNRASRSALRRVEMKHTPSLR
jgi:hypothetical protein